MNSQIHLPFLVLVLSILGCESPAPEPSTAQRASGDAATFPPAQVTAASGDQGRATKNAAGWEPVSCSQAKSKIEERICRSADLRRMDTELYAQYIDALSRVDDMIPIQASQGAWQRDDRDTCSTDDCVAESYARRRQQLLAIPGDDRVSGAIATAQSYENEASGFRGLNWGDPFRGVQDGMGKLAANPMSTGAEFAENVPGNYAVSRREAEKLSLGEAVLRDVTYVYESGRFYGAVVSVPSELHWMPGLPVREATTAAAVNSLAFLEAFQNQFGPPALTKVVPPANGLELAKDWHQWRGRVSNIDLYCWHVPSRECKAEIYSSQMRASLDAADRARRDRIESQPDF